MDRDDPTNTPQRDQPLAQVQRFEWRSEQFASDHAAGEQSAGVSPVQLFLARAVGITVLLATVAVIVFIALPVAIIVALVVIVLAMLAGASFIARAWVTAKIRQWQDPAGKRRNVRVREAVPGDVPPTN